MAIVGGARIASSRHADGEPTNMLGGQYSLPFTVAVALARDISNPVAFDENALRDPVVRALARGIEISEDSERFSGLESEMTLEIKGKRHTLQAKGFPGSLESPLDYDGVAGKFRRYAEPLIGQGRVESIIGMVRRLDGMADMSELAQFLSRPEA